MMLAQQSSGGGSVLLLMMLGLGAFLFWSMRQQKRRTQKQQNFQRSADVGDEIMTTAGIFGTIVEEDEDEDTVIVEIAPGTRIKMVRAAIARRIGEDEEDDQDWDDEDDDEQGDGDQESHEDAEAAPPVLGDGSDPAASEGPEHQ